MALAAQFRSAATMEDARKAVMSADAAVSTAMNKVANFIESESEVDPQVLRVLVNLERVHRTMMQATKQMTAKRLARGGGRNN